MKPVSRNLKTEPKDWATVRIAMVRYTHSDRVECNCGASRTHPREKVREDWIDRHFAKRHGGSGLRM